MTRKSERKWGHIKLHMAHQYSRVGFNSSVKVNEVNLSLSYGGVLMDIICSSFNLFLKYSSLPMIAFVFTHPVHSQKKKSNSSFEP